MPELCKCQQWCSCLQGLLLEDSEKLDSLSLLYYMSSVSIAMLLPAAVVMEQSAFHTVPGLAREHVCESPAELGYVADHSSLHIC